MEAETIVDFESSPTPTDGPPTSLEAVLAEVTRERREIFALVRGVLDDFEECAPWARLYNPPEATAELFGMVERLLGLVEGIPVRIDEVFEGLAAEADDATRQILEDAEFFLSGIHSLVTGECARLRKETAALRDAASATPATPKQQAYLCELAADLKGKYTSALMGAVSAIVSEGRWNSVDVEPVLFQEKSEEFRRNRELVERLDLLLAAIAQLGEAIDFQQILDRWQLEARVDLYALADLTLLQGRLLELLKPENRRALYSGDYRQILEREQAVGRRLRVLEDLHQQTWDESAATEAGDLFPRLRRLVLELIALLDVKLLELLVGESDVRSLRSRATAGGAGDSDDELATLVPLFEQEDLHTFLGMLATAVSQRGSLKASDSALEEPTLDEDLAAATALAQQSLVEGEGSSLSEAPMAVLVPGATTGEMAALRETSSIDSVSFDRLNRIFRQLRASDNPKWKSFCMVQRLLARQYRVPRAMLVGIEPYLLEVLTTLVPEVAFLERSGLAESGLARKLRSACVALSRDQITAHEPPMVLELFDRLDAAMKEISDLMDDQLVKRIT